MNHASFSELWEPIAAKHHCPSSVPGIADAIMDMHRASMKANEAIEHRTLSTSQITAPNFATWPPTVLRLIETLGGESLKERERDVVVHQADPGERAALIVRLGDGTHARAQP